MKTTSAQKFQFTSSRLALFFIVLAGTALRLYHLDGFSLFNDELSALYRTRFNSIGELFMLGVKTGDFHPAGVQLFIYYWVKLFGNGAFALRLPFALMGAASIVLVYVLGRDWFNKYTGLAAAAAIAFLHFPLLYSQVARPYSPGLLFTLVAMYFWSRIILKSNTDKKTLIGYVVAASLATYTHYFAFLLLIISGIAGLAIARGQVLRHYLLAALAVLVLYIPHLPIFLYQFGIGGVGNEEGWLKPPDSDWPLTHFNYIFNSSVYVQTAFALAVVCIVAMAMAQKKFKIERNHILALVFFASPLLIGYYYSIYRNPVLQHSILLFSFPFLLILGFSFFNVQNTKLNYFLIAAISIVSIWSTVSEKQYYRTTHFADFRDVAAETMEWNKEFGSENILKVANVNDRYYLDYYFEKLGQPTDFEIYSSKTNEELLSLRALLDTAKSPYLLYTWLRPSSAEVYDIISVKYPFVVKSVEHEEFSMLSLFSREPSAGYELVPAPDFSVMNDFESGDVWGQDSSVVMRDSAAGNQTHFVNMKGVQFSPTYEQRILKITNRPIEKVRVRVNVKVTEQFDDAQLVISLHSHKDDNYKWLAYKLEHFVPLNSWGVVQMTYEMPQLKLRDDRIKIFIWNPGKQLILIDDFQIDFYENY